MLATFRVPFWLLDDKVLKLCVETHLTKLLSEPAPLLAKQVVQFRIYCSHAGAVSLRLKLFNPSTANALVVNTLLCCALNKMTFLMIILIAVKKIKGVVSLFPQEVLLFF